MESCGESILSASARVSQHVNGSARIRIPEHVVYRNFGDETVILNLDSGKYHGLNATAALMVTALDESDSVAAAVDRIIEETGQPRDVIERDVTQLCESLDARGLIEHDGSGG